MKSAYEDERPNTFYTFRTRCFLYCLYLYLRVRTMSPGCWLFPRVTWLQQVHITYRGGVDTGITGTARDRRDNLNLR